MPADGPREAIAVVQAMLERTLAPEHVERFAAGHWRAFPHDMVYDEFPGGGRW